MTPARDPKQLFSMITSRVHSVRRRLCICISVQQEASGRHLGGQWRHLGGIWVASGGIWRPSGDQSSLEVKYDKTNLFSVESGVTDHFV